MAFELPDLPYPHDALAASGMSKETLEYHHDIHHKAYVDNGNKAIAGTEWEGKSVEEIVKGTYQKGAVAEGPPQPRNQALRVGWVAQLDDAPPTRPST